MRNNVVNMNPALIDTLLNLNSTAFKLLYEQEMMMNPIAVFQQCFDWFVIKYGCTLVEDCETNWSAMAANWHPSMGFEVLTSHLFCGVIFASLSSCPSQTRTRSTSASIFSTARDSSTKSTRLGSSMATTPAKQMTLSPSELYGRTQPRLLHLPPSLQASMDTAWLRPTTMHWHTHSQMRCQPLVRPMLPPKNLSD